MHRAVIETQDGPFTAWFSASGLCELDFPDRPRADLPANTVAQPPQLPEWVRLTRAALHAVLQGQAPGALPPLDLARGTEFQRKIWQALLAIPAGQTLTYGEIAAAAGSPSALRAAGAACGANPIPVLIPCHRVVAAGGRLGGFSGGLEWKRKLLQREGVLPVELI
jgi:O-6-methylguanine DNA methyltransferase